MAAIFRGNPVEGVDPGRTHPIGGGRVSDGGGTAVHGLPQRFDELGVNRLRKRHGAVAFHG